LELYIHSPIRLPGVVLLRLLGVVLR